VRFSDSLTLRKPDDDFACIAKMAPIFSCRGAPVTVPAGLGPPSAWR
jgi:hypothetical protein